MAPVDDFCFVNPESMAIARCKAGRSAHRAVDVDHNAASSADQMVVVVTDTILITGRRARGLDTAYQVLLDEGGECVVHRLTRYCADDRPNGVGQFVCRSVGMRRYRAHRCQPLGGYLHAVLTQLIFQSVHGAKYMTKSGTCPVLDTDDINGPDGDPDDIVLPLQN